jgi:hypothetical protein
MARIKMDKNLELEERKHRKEKNLIRRDVFVWFE